MKSSSLIFLLFLFILSLSLNLITPVSSQKPTTTDTNFIKRCCATTTYTKLCYATLLGSADQIHSNPKSMAAKSLEVAHNEAQYVAQISARLAKMRGVDKREKAVLSDCTMAAGNSAAQLESSMQRMSGAAAAAAAWTQMERSDVETWTSTAMTYATTCLEGLEGANNDMNEKVKKIVESKTVKLTQLTSNALALIKRYYVVSAAHHRNHHTNFP